jgi:tRNA(Ile)-lysidine synthase
MLKKFFDFNRLHSLIKPDTRLIIAASGGMDSMVLVDLCYKAGFDFAIAHCNFKLRGAESDEDAAFVKSVAKSMGFPCFENDFDTIIHAEKHKLSIQAAARDLRYAWFEQLLQSGDYQFYATGHHFDDKIETFLINLFRGTGISGLRSLMPKNGNCIRPLLFANRSDIEIYARQNQIEFRVDSSNQEDHYTRNKIRHFVIPAIEKTYPDFKKGFENTFYALKVTEDFVRSETSKITQKLVKKSDGKVVINIKQLKEPDNLELCLYEILKGYNFNTPTVREIFNSLEGISGKKFYSKTHKLVRERENLVITAIKDQSDIQLEYPILIDQYLTHLEKPVQLHFEMEILSSGFIIEKNRNIALLDFDKLHFPLTLRKPAPGDSFSPLGMKGKKKISDFFVDEKFSDEQKNNALVLLSGDEIVWLIGYRIDDRFKITPNTKAVFKIVLHPKSQ